MFHDHYQELLKLVFDLGQALVQVDSQFADLGNYLKFKGLVKFSLIACNLHKLC